MFGRDSSCAYTKNRVQLGGSRVSSTTPTEEEEEEEKEEVEKEEEKEEEKKEEEKEEEGRLKADRLSHQPACLAVCVCVCVTLQRAQVTLADLSGHAV